MSSKAIEETIGQVPNFQNEELEVEVSVAETDNIGGHPEGNEVQAIENPNGDLELDNNQGANSSDDEPGETTPPRAPTPMPLEDQSVSTEPDGARDWRDIGSPEQPLGEFALSPESQPQTPQHEDEDAGDGNPFPVEEPPAKRENGEPGNPDQGSHPSCSERKSPTELDLPGTSYEKVQTSVQTAVDSLAIQDALHNQVAATEPEPEQPGAPQPETIQPNDGDTPTPSFACPPTPEDSDKEEEDTKDTPSVAHPPTPEKSNDEEEEGGDSGPPTKKFKPKSSPS
ncbi:uncharacterized protein [Drosophila takahashii]|uniref:uncharacterized protein n=1 Tax=Drosophila takahashii TaxID=29030 RepID=UPI003899013F